MNVTQTNSTQGDTRGQTRMARAAFAVLIGAVFLGGCSTFKNEDRRQTYDGFSFKAKAKSVDRKTELEHFTVEVKRASQSIEAAGKAGHHEGTRYCIENFGPHKIDWVVHPLDQVDALQIVDDTLTLEGTCIS